MKKFLERFDSNRRVGMRVFRQEKENRPLYFIGLLFVLPIAPLFWAFFAMRDHDKPIAPKDLYP